MSNTPVKKKTSYLKYDRTLVYHDGVQLFVGTGARNRKFICLAVPSDETEEFLCVPVSDRAFADYLYEQIDLLALVKSSQSKKNYLLDFHSEVSKGYVLEPVSELKEAWLPAKGFFARSHTQYYDVEDIDSASIKTVVEKKIYIDGRWDAKDLASLPDQFLGGYAFLYTLSSAEQRSKPVIADMFKRYPWRGGFSAVQFHKGLYDSIPRKNHLAITGIEYHSPGDITLKMVPAIYEQIKLTCTAFENDGSAIKELFRDLRDGMSKRELLGRSLDEIDADHFDYAFVEKVTRELSSKMRFKHLDQLYQLAEGNWISTAKIFMSYYRRIKSLADFFETGKASFS